MYGRFIGHRYTVGRHGRALTWLAAAVLSLLAQVPIFLALQWLIERSVSDIDFAPPRFDSVAVLEPEASEAVVEAESDLDRPLEPLPEDEVEGAEELEGQLVSLPEPDQQVVPEEARHMSRYAVKVEREVKARQPSEDQRLPRKLAPERRPEQRPAPRAGEPDRTELSRTDPAGTVRSSSARPGEGEPAGAEPSAGEPSEEDGLALIGPSLAGVDPASKYSPSAAPFASDDYLPEVAEEGEANLLNSIPYRYAGFFERVKERVRQHWDPNGVYRLRDPTGDLYGHKDRYTVLSIVLDDRGYVLSTSVIGPSGLNFLDDEASRAFGAAGPFLNPPQGLVREGRIRFDFGFAFLLASSRNQMFWRWQ